MIHLQQLGKAQIIMVVLLSLWLENCSTNVLKHPSNMDNKLVKVVTEGKLRSEITYSPDGLVRSWVWFSLDGKVIERNNFTYNGLHLKRVDSYNSKSLLYKYVTFEYNTNGLLIQTNFYESENPNLSKISPLQLREHALSFNPLTKQVGEKKQNSNIQWTKPFYVGCEKYSYDASSFVSKTDFFNQKNTEVGYCVYEHDNSGNLMNETWYDSDMENSVTCRFEYEYDNKNNAALRLNLPFVLERTFSNNIVRKTGIGLGDTESVSYNYIYNDKNYPVKAIKLNSDGEETEVVEYVYQ